MPGKRYGTDCAFYFRELPLPIVKVIQRIGKEILLCIIELIQGKKMNALDLISGMSIQSHS